MGLIFALGGCRPRPPKHQPKVNAAVMGMRLNSVTPPHPTEQVPIMMAAAAESSFRAWSSPWPRLPETMFLASLCDPCVLLRLLKSPIGNPDR